MNAWYIKFYNKVPNKKQCVLGTAKIFIPMDLF